MSFFRSLADRVKQGLQRTSDVLNTDITELFGRGRPIDEALLEELEERLVVSDLGAPVAAAVPELGLLMRVSAPIWSLRAVWKTLSQKKPF